jgi:multiple sugar transport system substrate-binding protein
MQDSFKPSAMSRRRFLASSAVTVGTLAGGSALLGACGTSTTSGPSTSGVTTLTVMYGKGELTPDYIKEFEKLNPGIKVKFLEPDQTRLNAMLAGGTPPDFVRGPAVGSASNSARGLALNLDPYLEKSNVLKKDDLLSINDAWRWDGKQVGSGPYYGITKDWSQENTLWYNQEILDKAKIAHLDPLTPITYDQLFDMGVKMTVRQGGKTQIYGYGTQWGFGLVTILMAMIIQQNGRIYNADSTEVDFTTPQAQRAIEWFVNYLKANIGPSSLNPTAGGWDGPDFLAKRMAIMMGGYWITGNIATSGNDDIKANARLAPAPMMGPKRFSPSGAGIGAWIPAGSKNKEAAWKLMEYFMAGPPAHDRAKSGWGIPSLKSLLPEMPQNLPFQKEAFQSMQNELSYAGLLPDSPYIALSSYNSILDKYIQQVATKQISLTDACQKITADANTLLKRGKEQLS